MKSELKKGSDTGRAVATAPSAFLAAALFAMGLLVATPWQLPASEPPQLLTTTSYRTVLGDEQTLHAGGAGVIALFEKGVLLGSYRWNEFTGLDPAASGQRFHDVELVYDARWNRNRLLTAFASVADAPVADGLHTFQLASVYGYRLVEKERLSLTAGGGVAVSDFGIKGPGNGPWPAIPVPFLNVAYTGKFLTGELEFITGPRLAVETGAEEEWWARGEGRMDQFRDRYDLIYTVAAGYRWVGVGVDHQLTEVARQGSGEAISFGAHRLFASVDLTLLTVTGGYAFETWQRTGDERVRSTGTGWVLEIGGVIPLGGGTE